MDSRQDDPLKPLQALIQQPSETIARSFDGFSPVPSSHSLPDLQPISLSPLIFDQRAFIRLLEGLSNRKTHRELAREAGIVASSISHILNGTVKNPSLKWFVRFVEGCGGKVMIDFPKR